jgi:hypothetical protein
MLPVRQMGAFRAWRRDASGLIVDEFNAPNSGEKWSCGVAPFVEPWHASASQWPENIGIVVRRLWSKRSHSRMVEFSYRVIFQLAPSTPKYSNLGHCIPIWSLRRISVFQLGSFWGGIFHFGPSSSTYIPLWPPVMELFHYGPHQCRLSVVAGVLGGTHCESVWSRFGMVMLRPFYVRY